MTSYRIISIGTLSAHPLWDERAQARTGHATTTLIIVGENRILVDPSLLSPAIEARLQERSGLKAGDITQVFFTRLDADRRRCLDSFPGAALLAHEPEIRFAHQQIHHQIDRAGEAGDHAMTEQLNRLHRLLERVRPADDSLARGVDLFPLPGVSPGCCGLLLALSRQTVLICGDAIATIEHLEQGKVLPDCADLTAAQESFKEAIEIADVLVPGRDNIVLNPLRLR
jgi:glyoxylase-like metal-dependent hydrolase (beta-lactamase superfamily II)